MAKHGIYWEPQHRQRQAVRCDRVGGWEPVAVEGQHQYQAGVVLEGHVGYDAVQHLGPVGGHYHRHARRWLYGQAGGTANLTQAGWEGVVGVGGPPLGHADRLPVGGVLQAFGVDTTDKGGKASSQPTFGTGGIVNDHDGARSGQLEEGRGRCKVVDAIHSAGQGATGGTYPVLGP